MKKVLMSICWFLLFVSSVHAVECAKLSSVDSPSDESRGNDDSGPSRPSSPSPVAANVGTTESGFLDKLTIADMLKIASRIADRNKIPFDPDVFTSKNPPFFSKGPWDPYPIEKIYVTDFVKRIAKDFPTKEENLSAQIGNVSFRAEGNVLYVTRTNTHDLNWHEMPSRNRTALARTIDGGIHEVEIPGAPSNSDPGFPVLRNLYENSGVSAQSEFQTQSEIIALKETTFFGLHAGQGLIVMDSGGRMYLQGESGLVLLQNMKVSENFSFLRPERVSAIPLLDLLPSSQFVDSSGLTKATIRSGRVGLIFVSQALNLYQGSTKIFLRKQSASKLTITFTSVGGNSVMFDVP